MELVHQRCGFTQGFEVSAVGSKDGLCLAWKEDIQVRLRSFSSSFIDVQICCSDVSVDWRFTGFYGSSYESNKVDSWNELRKLGLDKKLPWLVCGNFNEILYVYEKRGGLPRDKQCIERFRSALKDCELFGLGYSACWYSWEKGNLVENNIRERLDRGVANVKWMECFPTVSIQHLNHSHFDHYPLLIHSTIQSAHVRPNFFKFEAL
ncbi:hypothetical protein J1N35_000563 [Gossypium stocksii]|uniref:Endonuclease/exonuclease/phosphatase domain-containing protein n=1 Tax=Gossypium stocksii TaxID=47602 RepID=A0A9D3WHV6_9ROSI|nr:hypothetical protein J1N35_000563 [Gossypium stocksii]